MRKGYRKNYKNLGFFKGIEEYFEEVEIISQRDAAKSLDESETVYLVKTKDGKLIEEKNLYLI